MEDAKRPNIKLKFRAGLSSSSPQVRDKHIAETPSPTMKFSAVELSVQQSHNGRPSSHSQSSSAPMTSPRKVLNGAGPLSYSTHAAVNASNGYASYQRKSPSIIPANGAGYPNGSQQRDAKQSYSPNPPHQQSAAPPAGSNGHASSSVQIRPQQFNGARPASDYRSDRYPGGGVHQAQNIAQERDFPTYSTPQARPSGNQTSYGAVPNRSTPHQGRLLSPVLNCPSMTPTQGNRDVGPVAGFPQRSPTDMGMSPPLQKPTNQCRQPTSNHPHYHNENQATSYTNGTPTTNQAHNPNAHNHHIQPQHQPRSGLSPTKHSPTLPSPAPHNVNNMPSPSALAPPPPPPPLPQATTTTNRRSVSGTPIFPPTELLQPSPKQLSKTPVPTPSKAMMTPASVGEGELRRVSEEIRERFERREG
jgi:hypothetical protein